MTHLKVGIASVEQYKARTLAIARGEYVPEAGEPKVWFQSVESLAQVLSDKNLALRAAAPAEQGGIQLGMAF